MIQAKINAVTILNTAIHGHPFFLEIGKKYQGKTITGINSVIGFYGVSVEYDDATIEEFINVPYILYRKITNDPAAW
jgi:hypothetical protein